MSGLTDERRTTSLRSSRGHVEQGVALKVGKDLESGRRGRTPSLAADCAFDIRSQNPRCFCGLAVLEPKAALSVSNQQCYTETGDILAEQLATYEAPHGPLPRKLFQAISPMLKLDQLERPTAEAVFDQIISDASLFCDECVSVRNSETDSPPLPAPAA
jgi:hypothetical protein